MELLTKDIAHEYRERAVKLPYNGMQDAGERRRLRLELQERCGVTELEAVNILNGFYVDVYCMKYLRKAQEAKARSEMKENETINRKKRVRRGLL